MRPPLIAGGAIAAVILLLGLLAPLFRSSAERGAAEGLRKSELARRLITEAGTRVSSAALATELDALRKVENLDELLAGARASLDALAEQFRRQVEEAQASDRAVEARGMPAGGLRPVSTDAGALRGAVEAVGARLAEDVKLIEQSAAAAREAEGTAGELALVKQVSGMVEYLRASIALAEAQRLRGRLDDQRARMLAIGSELKLAQSNIDHFVALDVTVVVADLQKRIEEFAAAEEEATRQAGALEQAVAQRKAELEQVGSLLAGARTELLNLEKSGFVAGDDAAFAEYRRRYLELSERLRELESQELTLRHGGLRNAMLEGADALTAEIVGGEPLESLAELEWRLADARRRGEGLRKAREATEQQIKHVRGIGEAAGLGRSDYEGRLARLREQLGAVQEERARLAAEAFKKEDEALRAAQAARQAFAAAGRAASNWVNAAAAVQREKDPNRLNERLKLITGDEFARRIGPSAEGAALLLVGVAHAQRIDDLTRELEARDRFAQFVPGATFGATETIDEIIRTAREAGGNALRDAIGIFESLAAGAGATDWVPRSGLSAAHYLMTRIEPAGRDAHLTAALSAAQQAVEGREHSPYLKPQVRFRDHLKRIAEGGPAPSQEPAAEGGPG